jgi:type I restriction-modification system DNA methylase subunit
MNSEFEFQAELFSEIKKYVSSNSTNFDEPRGEEQTDSGWADIYLPSSVLEGVVIEVKRNDIDPHSYEVIQQGHRYARDKNISLFATANQNDVFLFRRTKSATSITELDRRHYDLRQLSIPAFIEEFLTDVVELQQGDGVLFDFDNLIISRLRSFHTSIYPLYENLIGRTFERDSDFRDQLVSWAKSNDYPFERPDVENTFKIVAQQYAYLLMNRIVFYELVREQGVETESGFDLEPIYGGVALEKLDTHLEDCFENIITEIDYEAIFQDDSEFFEQIPDNEYTKRRLYEFTRSIQQEPLNDISVDVVGQIYQKLIPTKERKELGQFYTPDMIGQILSKWAIQSADDRFLDPCSGSGSITVEAYKRLDELDGLTHEELIQHITAVDINKFPLHLTALNLATRDIHEPTDELFAYAEDFFDLDPDTKRLASNRLGVRGSASNLTEDDEREAIGRFDATAANPPYVRQEHLHPNRDHFREHLQRFGPSSEQLYYDGGEKEIDGRSDLYCYFLTHVTQFLHEGGRLAWIVPTKWMVADYGPSLQQFLFDHYKVRAVVGFRKRVFEDALVDTVLLLMERCGDPSERLQTDVNFIRINQAMDPEDAIRVIDRNYGIPDGSYMKIQSRPNYRAIAVRQSHLVDNIDEKLHHFITAPALYTAVLEHPNTRELTELTTITRGKKTGANPIFILSEKDVETRNIEEQFLRPAIKSVKEVSGWEHTSADAEKWMLDVHDYVESVVATSNFGETSDIGDRVLDSLREDGYDGVLSYLRWADTQPASNNASLDAYDPWFNMGDLDPKTAAIVCPQAMDTRRFFFSTDGHVVASNRFLLIQPDGTDPDLLLGILNSSISKIVVESHGRVTGGGAVNLSSTDLHSLRVVDPDCLTEEQSASIEDGFRQLRAGDDTGLRTIDGILINVLDLDVSVDELQTIAENLKLTRRRKGQEVEPLIQELDELEGQIEMAFESDQGQQQGLAEFGG